MKTLQNINLIAFLRYVPSFPNSDKLKLYILCSRLSQVDNRLSPRYFKFNRPIDRIENIESAQSKKYISICKWAKRSIAFQR